MPPVVSEWADVAHSRGIDQPTLTPRDSLRNGRQRDKEERAASPEYFIDLSRILDGRQV